MAELDTGKAKPSSLCTRAPAGTRYSLSGRAMPIVRHDLRDRPDNGQRESGVF
jgi:hypothetical protein